VAGIGRDAALNIGVGKSRKIEIEGRWG